MTKFAKNNSAKGSRNLRSKCSALKRHLMAMLPVHDKLGTGTLIDTISRSDFAWYIRNIATPLYMVSCWAFIMWLIGQNAMWFMFVHPVATTIAGAFYVERLRSKRNEYNLVLYEGYIESRAK